MIRDIPVIRNVAKSLTRVSTLDTSNDQSKMIDKPIKMAKIRFPSKFKNREIKVPHIMWNQIYSQNKSWNESPLKELSDFDFMYFIHSYYVEPTSSNSILTKTNYDEIEFCSSVIQNNIFATQFHPEKSADKGISIYKNWALINNLI